jgi:hypothetical protein
LQIHRYYSTLVERKAVMFMNKKMKECFTPHVMMHSLFGLGLGIFLVSLLPSLASIWLGIGIMAVAFVFDYMRK